MVSAQVISGAYCPRVDGSFFGGFLLGLNIRVSVFVERGGFVWGGVPSEAISGGIIAPR